MLSAKGFSFENQAEKHNNKEQLFSEKHLNDQKQLEFRRFMPVNKATKLHEEIREIKTSNPQQP